jgi:hypothetical protein
MESFNIIRKDHEPPFAVESLGWKYHHMGIPTEKSIPGERYIPHLKMFVSGFETSPFGIEWMRFEKDCPISELVKRVPHIAFEVENLDQMLKQYSFELISLPSAPSEGVRVAMIKHNGVPIELIEFSRKYQPAEE